jgi:hypothetical protein
MNSVYLDGRFHRVNPRNLLSYISAGEFPDALAEEVLMVDHDVPSSSNSFSDSIQPSYPELMIKEPYSYSRMIVVEGCQCLQTIVT